MSILLEVNMKKILFILVACILLQGCNINKVTDDPQTKYMDFVQLLNEQENYASASIYYDVNVEMVKVSEEEYRYYVFIDNPALSMYDIQAIASDVADINNLEVMAPSIGILDQQAVHMIPNQSNVELGYSKGVVLSGIKKTASGSVPELDLRLLIQWYNVDRSNQIREFISIQYKHVQGETHDDPVEEAPEEEVKEEE